MDAVEPSNKRDSVEYASIGSVVNAIKRKLVDIVITVRARSRHREMKAIFLHSHFNTVSILRHRRSDGVPVQNLIPHR